MCMDPPQANIQLYCHPQTDTLHLVTFTKARPGGLDAGKLESAQLVKLIDPGLD